jgi:hypothetical protein
MTNTSTDTPLPIVAIVSAVDPRDLQANRRFKNSHVLPTPVRKAMTHLEQLSYTQVATTRWKPTRSTRYAVDLTFTFPTANSDIDGPIKRTIDAVFRGMRRACDHPSVNDARVVELHVTKRTGTPGLTCLVREIDTSNTP